MGLRGPKPASLEEARRNRARVRPRNLPTVKPTGEPQKRADLPAELSAIWDEIVPGLVDRGRVGAGDEIGLECLIGLIHQQRTLERPNYGELFRWQRAYGLIPDSPIRVKDVVPKSLNNVEKFLQRA